MKLNEINYYKGREITQSEYDKISIQSSPPIKSQLKRKIQSPSREKIGIKQGTFGVVVNHHDQYSVNKYATSDIPYNYFVGCVTSDAKILENPHLPRFRKIVKGKQETGFYQIEKLYATLFEFFKDVDSVKQIINLYIEEDSESDSELNLMIQYYNSGSAWHISRYLANMFLQRPQDIKNKKFAEAIGLVEKWLHDGHNAGIPLYLDLSPNNIMVRLTSTGPQLVITDPYS